MEPKERADTFFTNDLLCIICRYFVGKEISILVVGKIKNLTKSNGVENEIQEICQIG